MLPHLANRPQIHEIETDLRSLVEAVEAVDVSNQEEREKILATYTHFEAKYDVFKDAVMLTRDAKEECYNRLRKQTQCHKRFMSDLDIAWAAYDALLDAIQYIESEIEGRSHINLEKGTLDAASHGRKDLFVLMEEREIAERACENSDRLCADMTELAELQREELVQLRAEWKGVCGEVEVLEGGLCVFEVVRERIERAVASLLEIGELTKR